MNLDDLSTEVDTFGEFDPTDEQIARHLLDYICPAGEPHTGDDPTTDHGHTQCFWIGLAIQRLVDGG